MSSRRESTVCINGNTHMVSELVFEPHQYRNHEDLRGNHSRYTCATTLVDGTAEDQLRAMSTLREEMLQLKENIIWLAHITCDEWQTILS